MHPSWSHSLLPIHKLSDSSLYRGWGKPVVCEILREVVAILSNSLLPTGFLSNICHLHSLPVLWNPPSKWQQVFDVGEMIHLQKNLLCSHIIELAVFLASNAAMITVLTSGHLDPQLRLWVHSLWLVPNMKTFLVLLSSSPFDFILYYMTSSYPPKQMPFSFPR